MDSRSENNTDKENSGFLDSIYEFIEMIAIVAVSVMLVFAFVARLNVVDGDSMRNTLKGNERLVVSDLFYEPTPGDIIVVQNVSAYPYNRPLVKRVIAVGGQTIDIDFSTWTLTVDGEVVNEPYRFLDVTRPLLTCEYDLPITLGENEIFIMGDNRNGSGDSRQIELGPVDKRCVLGKALVRVYPIKSFTVFENPLAE